MKISRKWRRKWQRTIVATAAVANLWTMVPSVQAMPVDGAIAAGKAAIAQNGSTMNITQSTNKAIINWQSFSIGKGETVNFIQSSSSAVALNRVLGNNASQIFGQLNANGRVFLTNPSGILFGAGAQVHVGGIVASSLQISDQNFLQGMYKFSGSGGAVTNQGEIRTVDGGYAVLLGGKAVNEGVIVANKGTVALAAGNQATLDMDGDGLINLAVGEAAINAQIENKNLVQADGGLVVMTAKAANTLAGAVINNRGIIRASSFVEKNGKIVLDGGSSGVVAQSGTLDVSGQTGGTIKVLGSEVQLADGARLNASGLQGGGTILVGGSDQGKGAERNALTTTVSNNVTINASAIEKGNGGHVVVWADKTTNYNGTITAVGGAQGGNGGSVEVSGKEKLNYNGTVDLRAANGKTGDLLLDPDGYTIGSGGDRTGAQIQSDLATANVTILSTSGTGSGGDITVNDTISWSNGNSLTLKATRDVNVNASISATGSGNISLIADTGGTGTGTVTFASSKTASSASGDVSVYYNPSTLGTPVSYSGKISSTSGSAVAYQLINSSSQLQSLGGHSSWWSQNFALSKDINVNGVNLSAIGNSGTNFTGKFDGQGHVISNFARISGSDYDGFFGYVKDGVLKNIGLSNVNLTNTYIGGAIGGLAGAVENGTVINCYTTGSVDNSQPSSIVGGLVGGLYGSSSISQSYSTAQVGGAMYVGGLVGQNLGMISNSYTASSSPLNGYSGAIIGGLVGINENGTIAQSFSTSNVTAIQDGSTCAGGLVGQNYGMGQINNSYSRGMVIGSVVGGLVGWNQGSIINSYSTGSVNGDSVAGGLIGFADGSPIVTDSYWDVVTSGAAFSDGGAGRNTTQMKTNSKTGNTFSTWDTAIWNIQDGAYPLLQWHDPGVVTVNLYADNKTITYGALAPTYTYTLKKTDGTALASSLSSGGSTYFTGTPTIGSAYTQGSNKGNYDINISNTGISAWSSGYQFGSAVKGVLQVDPAILTYTANAASRTYGAANPTFSGTVTGFVNSDTQGTATSGTLSFTTAATATSNVGSYMVTGSGLTANNGNYTFQQAGANSTALTINPATLTYTANAASRTYGAANPSLSGTVTGFVNSDTQGTVTSGTLSFTTAATATSNAGSYTVTGSGLTANNGNYTFQQAGANSTALTINPATLTYTANAASRTYGAANPNLSGTVTGFVNGETQGTVTSGTLSFTTAATATSNAGSYMVTGSGLTANNGNYTFQQAGANSTALTINPATLTYTANAASRTYGAANPTFSGTVTGFVNSDTQGTATSGTLSFTTAATATSNVGSYMVTGSGLTANNGNYTFQQAGANSTALTINPATLTYTANAASRTYGAANPSLSGTVTGFVNGETQGTVTSGTLSFTTAATATSNAGSYMVTGSGLTANNGNYTFQQAGANSTALTINPATLTYTANAASRTYGAANPSLSGTVTGFVNGETQGTVTSGTLSFTTAATATSNAGSYMVTGSGLTANNGNYTFQQAGANSTALTINPATLTYTANAASRTYGAANPTFSGTVTGFVNSDTQGTATSGTLSFTTAATATSNVGSYMVTGSGLTANNGNYTFQQAGANSTALTINPATLTYVANAASRTYGAANPSLSGTVTGFVNSDTQGTVTSGTLSFTTAATATSNAGSYMITGSGLTVNNSNYTLQQANANSTALTINPATLTYTANTASRTYGASNPVFSGTVTGFVNGETQGTATSGTMIFTSAATDASNVGSYAINGSGLTANNGNYTFQQAGANSTALTINPATLIYTADTASRTYGASNPAFSGTVTGFVNGETQGTATSGTLSFTSTATAGSNVGSYMVTGSGLTANHGNYTFQQAGDNSSALTITPAILAYTANAASRTYGTSNPAFSGTVTGFVNGDTQGTATSGTLSFTSTATAASNVGSYTVTGSGLTVNSNNYTLQQADANSTALAINPAILTYTANTASRTYGASNPAFSGTVTGFVNNETQGAVTSGTLNFASTAAAASNVGSYAITGSGLTANHGNYTFQQASANSTALTINPATLTYVANSASKTAGNANPALSGTVTGFVNGETQGTATTGTLQWTTSAAAGSPAGSYMITGSGLTANHGNYSFVQAAGNALAFTVYAVGAMTTVDLWADNKTIKYGDAAPAYTYTLKDTDGTTLAGGLSAGGSSYFTGTPTVVSAYTQGSNKGSYDINISNAGISSWNTGYQFGAAHKGLLQVDPAILTYVANVITKTAGNANPVLNGIVVGFVNNDTQGTATTGNLQWTTTAMAASPAGSYAVNGSGLTANYDNYIFVQAAGNNTALTVTPAPAVIPAPVISSVINSVIAGPQTAASAPAVPPAPPMVTGGGTLTGPAPVISNMPGLGMAGGVINMGPAFTVTGGAGRSLGQSDAARPGLQGLQMVTSSGANSVTVVQTGGAFYVAGLQNLAAAPVESNLVVIGAGNAAVNYRMNVSGGTWALNNTPAPIASIPNNPIGNAAATTTTYSVRTPEGTVEFTAYFAGGAAGFRAQGQLPPALTTEAGQKLVVTLGMAALHNNANVPLSGIRAAYAPAVQ